MRSRFVNLAITWWLSIGKYINQLVMSFWFMYEDTVLAKVDFEWKGAVIEYDRSHFYIN